MNHRTFLIAAAKARSCETTVIYVDPSRLRYEVRLKSESASRELLLVHAMYTIPLCP